MPGDPDPFQAAGLQRDRRAGRAGGCLKGAPPDVGFQRFQHRLEQGVLAFEVVCMAGPPLRAMTSGGGGFGGSAWPDGLCTGDELTRPGRQRVSLQGTWKFPSVIIFNATSEKGPL